MDLADPQRRILADIRNDLEGAAARILSLTCAGMDLIRDPAATNKEALEAVFTGLLEACSFQDVASQRLDQLEAQLTDRTDTRPDNELLNGPASTGAGLDQAAADLLFAGPEV